MAAPAARKFARAPVEQRGAVSARSLPRSFGAASLPHADARRCLGVVLVARANKIVRTGPRANNASACAVQHRCRIRKV